MKNELLPDWKDDELVPICCTECNEEFYVPRKAALTCTPICWPCEKALD